MKTFKEASEELKITKQTLTSWIKELNESNNIIWKNKTRYLDETLLNKIKKYKNVENNDNLFSENKSKNFDEKENLKSELKIALDHYEYNGEIKNYSEVEKTQQEDSSQPQRTNFQDIDTQRKGFWKKLFGKK